MNQNTGLVRIVVIFLGVIVLAVVVGAVVLAYQGIDIPAALIGLGSVALGALGGILTTPGGSNAITGSTPTSSSSAAPTIDLGPVLDQLDKLVTGALGLKDSLAKVSTPAPAPTSPAPVDTGAIPTT